MKKPTNKPLLDNCFVEIYDDAVVLTGKSLSLTISNCDFIRRDGEDAPELADGQFAISTANVGPFFA